MTSLTKDDNYSTAIGFESTVSRVISPWKGNPTNGAGYVELQANPLITGAPKNGQAKIASTGTAVQLGSNTLTNGVIITALSTNTASITVGGSSVTNTTNGTGNGYILEAGASASWAVSNTNQLWINGTAGDIVSFAGS